MYTPPFKNCLSAYYFKVSLGNTRQIIVFLISDVEIKALNGEWINCLRSIYWKKSVVVYPLCVFYWTNVYLK